MPKISKEMALGELPQALGYLLRLACRASDRLVIPVFAAHGLTRAEVTALVIIISNPDSALQDITQALGVELPAAQRLVNSLHDKEYVTRSRPAHDKRVTLYRATEAGMAQATAMMALSKEADHAMLEGLSDSEQAELLRLLRYLGRNTASGMPKD